MLLRISKCALHHWNIFDAVSLLGSFLSLSSVSSMLTSQILAAFTILCERSDLLHFTLFHTTQIGSVLIFTIEISTHFR